MDLIDRGKLKEDILKWLPKDRCGEEDYGIPFEENIVVSVMMEIDEQPTVDAEPIRHGHWLEEKKHFEDDWGGYNYTTYICSDCKNREKCNSNYCPNCGARMDGDKQ